MAVIRIMKDSASTVSVIQVAQDSKVSENKTKPVTTCILRLLNSINMVSCQNGIEAGC